MSISKTLLPEDGLWNDSGIHPFVRVECTNAGDVAVALRAAAEHNVRVSIWGGRCDVQARDAGANDLVIDLRRMHAVRRTNDQVIVQGGATNAHLLAALPKDIAAVTTANTTVGLVGATTGGGYGPLLPKFGAMCDQLVSAKLVLADSTVVRADINHDAELLWALRGGGTGFGVVTEMTLNVHHLGAVQHAVISVPLDVAGRALLMAQDSVKAEPNDLSILPLFTRADGPEPCLMLTVHWTGVEDTGAQIIATLASLQGAQVARNEVVPYAETFGDSENALWPAGNQWVSDTRTVADVNVQVAGALVDSARRMPMSGCVLFLQGFHGAATSVPAADSAFALRSDHFIVAMTGRAAPGDTQSLTAIAEWVEATASRLDPLALPGGYVNFLPIAAEDRVAQFYGDMTPTLTRLRTRVDPGALFTGTTGLMQPGA